MIHRATTALKDIFAAIGPRVWHQPWLRVTDEDGVMTQLYRWHGRLVGHDHFRLVSDSKVIRLHYGNDGSLLRRMV